MTSAISVQWSTDWATKATDIPNIQNTTDNVIIYKVKLFPFMGVSNY